jgi:hypothetical protein
VVQVEHIALRTPALRGAVAERTDAGPRVVADQLTRRPDAERLAQPGPGSHRATSLTTRLERSMHPLLVARSSARGSAISIITWPAWMLATCQ